MDRVAVFVDAGYLFAQGSVALAGEKLPRSRLVLDNEQMMLSLSDFAKQVSGASLLRVYWYDGTSSGPTAQHISLAYLHELKLRLGFVNSVGEQKGVDSLIITDMINLARNRAMTDAILLSGDEDLRVGVQQAQEFGVRVHLLGIEPSRGSQSLFLLQEADTTHEWGQQQVARFLACRRDESAPSSVKPEPATAQGAPVQTRRSTIEVLEEVARRLALEIDLNQLDSLVMNMKSTAQIPRIYDARLLAKSRSALGRALDGTEKQEIRQAFLSACESRLRTEPAS